LRIVDYGLGHDDRTKEYHPITAQLAPFFIPWQIESNIEEYWEECARLAENLKRLLLSTFNSEPKQSNVLVEEQPLANLLGKPMNWGLFGNITGTKPGERR
jgi:hypothetical protein